MATNRDPEPGASAAAVLRRAGRRLAWLVGSLAALALLFGLVYFVAPGVLLRAATWQRAWSADLATHTVQAGDTRWAYYEGGNGPTIVLLHGFDSDKRVWLEVAPKLTAHFHVVIPDLPGWGDSSRIDTADYGVTAQAGRLADFVAALKLDRFVLAGHSMGGAIAGVYAAEHPGALAGLALIDSGGLGPLPETTGSNPFLYDNRAGFERMMQLAFAQPPHYPGRIVDAIAASNAARHDFLQRTWARLQQPGQRDALASRLDELTLPVLAIHGADDKLVDIAVIDTLRRGLVRAPTIDTATLSHCGHVPPLEKPAATARILADFTLRH